MAPLRIRHAKGIATIDLDLETATVLELQQEIRRITNILPSLQDGQKSIM
jgi:ubiquitin thioesterase OTU1